MQKTATEELAQVSDVEKQLARIVPLWGAIVRYQQKAGIMEPVSLLSWCVRLYQAGYEDGGAAVFRHQETHQAQGRNRGTAGEEGQWGEEESGRSAERIGVEGRIPGHQDQ